MRALRAQRHRKLCRIRNIMRAKSLNGVAAVIEFLENPEDAKLLEDVVTRHYMRDLVIVDNDVVKENENAN